MHAGVVGGDVGVGGRVMRDAVIREVVRAMALEAREALRPMLPPCPACEGRHWPVEACVDGGWPYAVGAIEIR